MINGADVILHMGLRHMHMVMSLCDYMWRDSLLLPVLMLLLL
jgi:hypothetical protein